MTSRTISGPAAVKSCEPILNMPATSLSASINVSAFSFVSTSRAMISLSVADLVIDLFCFLCLASCGGCFQGTTANCVVKRSEVTTFQNLNQSVIDPSRYGRAFIDEAGIKLHQAGSGANFSPGIRGGKDSSDSDYC